MNNILAFLNNTWFRLSGVFVGAVLSLFVISAVFNFFVITPIELDVRDSRRGVSRFEGELSRLEKEVQRVEKKIIAKSKLSQGRYEHYYTLYSNPVRYINQFVLNQAKPDDLLVISSSVMPNASLTSVERSQIKPYLKQYGISRIKNLTKTFSVTRVSLNATGSFPVIGQYLSNLNDLPVKFSIRNFELKENNKSLVLSLEMAFIVYRMKKDT